jgi:hypothetical protein
MKHCIYCRQEKPDEEFSLEHVIPQFLGGSQSPDCLKTRDACKRCNSNLGLFVDASFEKDFLVFNNLTSNSRAFFNPAKPIGLPIQCLGKSQHVPPGLSESEVCEYWLGPLGEQILWVRPNDERMYWYSGGNPIDVKSQDSRAYFICSERSNKNPLLTLLTFKEAFLGRKVSKIMCTEVVDCDLSQIGFSEPNELDKERITFFLDKCGGGKEQHNQLMLNVAYDHRFLAKLGLGISYCLFGEKALESNYGKELQKALWHKSGSPTPQVMGSTAMGNSNDASKELCGLDNAVTIAILIVGDHVAVNLNINKQLNWSVKCANAPDLLGSDLGIIGEEGLCIVLYKPIQKCVQLSLAELIAHKTGDMPHPELISIEKVISNNAGYFENL